MVEGLAFRFCGVQSLDAPSPPLPRGRGGPDLAQQFRAKCEVGGPR